MLKKTMEKKRHLKISRIKDSKLYQLVKVYFNWSLKKRLIWSLIFATIRIVFSLAWPYLLYKQLFQNEKIETDSLSYVIPIVIAIFSISQWAVYKQLLTNIKINDQISLKLITDLWRKMVSLEWLSFKSKNRVYYFDIFLVDFWRIRHGIMALLEVIIPYSVISFALLFFLLYISPPIFILYLIGFVLTTAFQLISNLKLRTFIRKFHEAWRKQSINVSVSIDQYDLVRMDRGYEQSSNNFNKNSAEFLDANSKMLIAQSKWKIIIQIVIQFTRLAVLVTGIYWVNSGLISWGEFFFTIFVIGIIQTNLTQLPGGINELLEALESFNRMNEYFDLDSEKNINQLGNEALTKTIDSIAIQDMDFGYDTKKTLFEDYSISLKKGNVYLWVGPNGSGKSTLSHILMGLIKPKRGELKINEISLNWDELKLLRSDFAFIHQDALLFAGSIKENITFGHESTIESWEKVKKSWLSNLLPSGIIEPDRRIGERGEGLSGGEAKRIILIREWLRSCQLIVLDEPLNHLDSQSIKYVTKEIEILKKDAIIIIISHQSGFESIADEIIEINKKKWKI